MSMTKSGPSTTCIALGIVCVLAVAVSGLAVWAQNPPQNSIRIYTVKGKGAAPARVEVEVSSTKEFPVRNEVVILDVGGKEFTQSRSPEDGSLNKLIFMLGDQFGALAEGADIVVRFGKSGAGEKWNFGKLNKALLDKN